MPKLSAAQQILVLLGVDSLILLSGKYRTKSKHPRKSGPGRIHQQGKPTVVRSEGEY